MWRKQRQVLVPDWPNSHDCGHLASSDGPWVILLVPAPQADSCMMQTIITTALKTTSLPWYCTRLEWLSGSGSSSVTSHTFVLVETNPSMEAPWSAPRWVVYCSCQSPVHLFIHSQILFLYPLCNFALFIRLFICPSINSSVHPFISMLHRSTICTSVFPSVSSCWHITAG